MRHPKVIANWKMFKTESETRRFIGDLKKKAKEQSIIAVPFPNVSAAADAAKGSSIKIAAQDVSVHTEGAYTGEVSAKMLYAVGVRYGIVGHSERRIYHNEADYVVNQKIHRLLEKKIIPIMCFGETQAQRNAGKTRQVIAQQLKTGLKGVKHPGEIIFAYEPVWAISSFQKGKNKKTAAPADIEQVHGMIKDIIKKIYPRVSQKTISVYYGGSVSEKSAKDILAIPDVDGLLVGSASLKLSSFTAILKSASK